MSINVEQLKQNTNIVDIISKYVSLKKNGSEYYGICPFHDDTKTSLQVNEKLQIFKCFACGGPSDKGGDSLHFLQGIGRTFVEALEELNGGKIENEISPNVKSVVKKTIVPTWKNIQPNGIEPLNLNHYIHGEPSKKWMYHNAKGEILGYVCRFDLANGEKEVLPFSYATDGTRSDWRWIGLSLPRPLYNLHHILSSEKTIIVVEGEKTADVVQKNIPSAVVTTWIGGANGIKNSDFSYLKDRNVILWPDNDKAGHKAMIGVNEIIKDYAKQIFFIQNSTDKPNKWDAADQDWKQDEMRDYIINHKTEVPIIHTVLEAPKKPEPVIVSAPKNPPLPPRLEVSKNDLDNGNEHFKLLGYDKDENGKAVYFFFSYGAKMVIKLSPTSMNKSNLKMLAPMNYWETNYSNGQKINLDQIENYLINSSHKVGVFKDKYIRGRGVWMDKDKLVIHTGENLLIDGKNVSLKLFKSRYVYEIGENLGFGSNEKLLSAESNQLINKIKWLRWEREIDAYLLLGWCVIAPFCGVLNWRPHVWVTGPAGSGKSWVMDNVIKRLMGEIAIVVQGKTTEAGVRGTLQSDARPVLFDESDVDSQSDKERIQSILALARSSSTGEGGTISKGTQSGAARTYTIRSCFAFSSIGVQLNQQSDRSRFTTLSLKSFDGFRAKNEFIDFEIDWNKSITEDFVKKLQSRTTNILPVILENSKTFSDAASHVIGNRRVGDQIGSMLAGAFSLSSNKIITYEDAVKWVTEKDWTEEKGLEATKDENQLFSLLMGQIIEVEAQFGNIKRSIGEVIIIAANLKTELGVTVETANNRLRRSGIMVINDLIYISNTAQGIKEIIKNTSWASNHNKVLERMPGAVKCDNRMFYPGLKSRSVSIPLSMLQDENALPLELVDDMPF